MGVFHEEELLLRKLSMSYYREPNIHIRDEVKLFLDL